MAYYTLQLFVSKDNTTSSRAIANLPAFAAYLGDRGDIAVIDIFERPELARHSQVIATPVLIRTDPPPTSRIVTDLSEPEDVLNWLGIESINAGSGHNPPKL